MKKVDYIVVGFGIAGIALCEHLLQREKSFVVIDQNSGGATLTAGGVVNPMVLKRFNAVWKASEFLNYAHPFYKALQGRLNDSILNEIAVQRVFNSFEEQNQWMASSDQKKLAPFLEPEIVRGPQESWQNTFGMGKVRGSFQIDTKVLIDSFKEYLRQRDAILFEPFNYKSVVCAEDLVQYKNVSATCIIFAEGAAALQNPFFPKEHLIPKKGEYITVKAPQLKLQTILKAGYFIIPLANDCYKVGATFAHGDLTLDCTQSGRTELEIKLKEVLKVPFEVISQEAGMRPTVKDHRPLLGKSKEFELVYFLNGLGARGLLMAPLLAHQLIQYTEDGIEIPEEVNIHRFKSRLSQDHT